MEKGTAVARPLWMKQAEEARLKEEEQKAAAAKAAFEATFKDVENPVNKETVESDNEIDEESEKLDEKPIGPVDPSKCTAAGAGVSGGAAGAPTSFVVITKDSDGRKVPTGGADIKVFINPDVGVGSIMQEALVKDLGDGTYSVTYAVAKRGNYMVRVECNGKQILGSPFPVFFSAGNLPVNGSLYNSAVSSFPNGVSSSMPNYSGMLPGMYSGSLGMIPGIRPGVSGGVVLPGLGASLGEVCQEYLNGQCGKTDCKLNHPAYPQLMAVLSAGSNVGGLTHMPLPPSAAAMAAAQAIVAAQALQAHAAQSHTSGEAGLKSNSGSSTQNEQDCLSRTLQVSNFSSHLTLDQLQQVFNGYGNIMHCEIVDSKKLAYIEFSKVEEAKAALALNKRDMNGRQLSVEMAKSLSLTRVASLAATSSTQQSPLPMMMQQAVAMQQMQFKQALLMQQTMASQQAASRAASMKSATEMASARAAEISKKLKAEGVGMDEKASNRKSRSCKHLIF
eukprot:TRINITY_DN94_c0_g2_i1.p1 TRINITY_DN94_c0_g2~~TRINITY_DN94_c0_g2_i1.p1  ORF type:complete len:505 (+),score=126.51 TRINITY_DN94_c0_g2_i1:363-1877(+)